MYTNTRSRIYAYGDVSPEFFMSNGVCHLFFLSFFIEMITEIVLPLCKNNDIEICLDRELSDPE